MLSTEELMLDATLVPTLSIEAEAVSRALWSAPETTSMPMPMPIPEARRKASILKAVLVARVPLHTRIRS